MNWNDEEMAVKLKKKYGVFEEIQNQDGVVFFSNLETATKIALLKLDINNIGYLLDM